MAVEFDGERMVKKEDNTLPEHPVNPLCACTAFSCNKLFLFLYAWLYLVGINSIFKTSFVLILRLHEASSVEVNNSKRADDTDH